ncbi:SH3-binding, glutamic acid-rich protein-domain-containing protein [Phycomyces blakesleeanus]
MIAQQKAELEALKQQLAMSHPTESTESAEPTPPVSQSSTFSDLAALQAQKDESAQLLQEKEDQLKERELEIEKLRVLLEQEEAREREDVPTLVVSQPDESEALLAEMERELAAKQAALEQERKAWEEERKTLSEAQLPNEQVSLELEQLRLKNEEALRLLESKEKELETIRNQTTDAEPSNLQEIEELQRKLEAQKQAHEESLRLHEMAIEEKERLMAVQKEEFEKLDEEHMDEIRKLKTSKNTSIIAIKLRHKKDMSDLQKRLAEAENAVSADPAAQLNDEIERILNEFEQAEHNHTAEIKSLEETHQSELENLEVNHVSKLRSFKNTNANGWTSRFLPTEAVSWPKPSTLPPLRKTTGPTTKPKFIVSGTSGPILLPLDNKKIQVYYSSVSGNPVIKKNQESIQQLLGGKSLEFEMIDVASSEAALKHMKLANNNGSTVGRAKEVPQLFVGGEYRGQYDDVLRAVEEDCLETLLVPAAERVLTAEERAAAEAAEAAHASQPKRVLPAGPLVIPVLRKTMSTKAITPVRGSEFPTLRKTVSTKLVKPLRDHDDDEEMFRQLELELGKDKLKDANFDDIFA